MREGAWKLADWTILLTDAPAQLLNLQEALVLVRERWQMEMLYKLWKQYGQIDEWRTTNPWRVLCELYAKLIGLLLRDFLILLFAWHDEQRRMPQTGAGDPRCCLFSSRSSCGGALASLRSSRYPASHAFWVSIEQAQEASQRCPTPSARLDQLGVEPLSWCVWGDMQKAPIWNVLFEKVHSLTFQERNRQSCVAKRLTPPGKGDQKPVLSMATWLICMLSSQSSKMSNPLVIGENVWKCFWTGP